MQICQHMYVVIAQPEFSGFDVAKTQFVVSIFPIEINTAIHSSLEYLLQRIKLHVYDIM